MIQAVARLGCAACVVGALGPALWSTRVSAEMKKKPGSVEGSPLDTLLSYRLWTTPPNAKDFVRETRPDTSKLDYTPLYGQDPNRPKPRDAANVKALQAELEHDIEQNERRAKALGGISNLDALNKASATKPEAGRRARRSAPKSAAKSTPKSAAAE